MSIANDRFRVAIGRAVVTGFRERAGQAVEGVVRAVAAPVVGGIAAFNRRRLPPRDAPHPLLTGIHAPMTGELTLADLAVEGFIPPELDGRYVRIGPNPAAADPRSYHFFTGDGMLHGIRIAGGRALWYRNRWIRSTDVAKARGVPPAPGPRLIFDTVNTSVLDHAGSGWALVEAGSTPVRFDEHLEAQRYDDFGGTLPGSFTAHPRRDPATGELHALCYEATDPKRVRYNVVDVAGRVRRSVVIPVSHGPLIHDCAITARYVVVMDLPLTLSMRTVLSGHGFPYRWNVRHPARIGLLPREGGAADMMWIPLDPCFVFHTANAHDLPDGRVVLDVVAYDRMFAGDNLAPDEQPRGLERWTLDPVAGTVEQRVLDRTPQELPTIDARRTGLPYRYAYALGLPEVLSETLVGAAPLLKHDLRDGTRQRHDFGPSRVAGEFVFVPRAPDAAEDDGWLIGLVIEADGQGSALEILDARDVTGAPVAAIRIPHRVPPGIHGAWFPTPG
jgi:carotenoid cleavage dioxygenase